MKIYVIDSGFVYIGYGESFEDSELGKCVIIRHAHNIRRWGTDKNLGQLAYEGKQKETILDFTGTITVPVSRIIHSIEVTEEAAKTYGF